MPGQEDTFEENVVASSGSLIGDYLWSDPDNWSTGIVPINGDSVTVDIPSSIAPRGYDDIANLSLAALVIDQGLIEVEHTLTIGTLSFVSNAGFMESDTSNGSGNATLIINGLTSGDSPDVGANGLGAFTEVNAADPGNSFFYIDDGGVVELTSSLSSSSSLEYFSLGTFALEHPNANADNNPTIIALEEGDVLELPGTAVISGTVAASSLTFTTNAGTYAFREYLNQGSITGYTAAFDPSTGLEAITFTGPDTFEELGGNSLWSNAANWSAGVPVNGDSVTVNTSTPAFDDIANLSLAALVFGTGQLEVEHTLTIGNLTMLDSTVFIESATSPGSGNATLTINGINSNFENVGADGLGAFTEVTAADPGNNYYVEAGGLLELASSLSPGSQLDYEGPGTFALADPSADNGAEILAAEQGDVLELPGTAVTSVAFAANSLTIATSAGTYAFSDFINVSPLTGYTAAFDPRTGLEAITFTGPDTFEEGVAASSGPLAGEYLWSNAANWSTGSVPVNGDSVTATGVSGYDDLPSLSLSDLTLAAGGAVYVTGGDLNVGTVVTTGSTDQLIAYGSYVGASYPVVVTAGDIIGAGGEYEADGPTSTFISNAATDPGGIYFAQDGGLVELAAAPNDSSFLEYGGLGTIALENPSANNGALLLGVAQGDVLELPGTAVSSVGFGASSVTIATNAGTYAFNNVVYSGDTVSAYTASFDAATGWKPSPSSSRTSSSSTRRRPRAH